jgi:hypothetical protein
MLCVVLINVSLNINIPLADEANMLMKWKELESTEPQLESLLAFLVAVSKQANLVHVVLATSDYFLASWLKGSKYLNLYLCCRTIKVILISICFCRGSGQQQL